MSITVEGNLIVKGDQIFDGGVKIVRIAGAEKEKEPLTEELLKQKVEAARNLIDKARLWFPVCKYMMWEGLVPEGDFEAALAMLQGMFPDVSFDPKDFSSKLNVGSFRKPLSEWVDDDSSPVHNTTFSRYKNIAELMYHA